MVPASSVNLERVPMMKYSRNIPSIQIFNKIISSLKSSFYLDWE